MKFNVGQYVRVTAAASPCFGKNGIITFVYTPRIGEVYEVKLDDYPAGIYFNETELEVIRNVSFGMNGKIRYDGYDKTSWDECYWKPPQSYVGIFKPKAGK